MKVCFYTYGHLGDFIITIPFITLLIEQYPDNEYYQCIHGGDGTVIPEIFLKAVPNLKPTDTPCGDLNIPTWFGDKSYHHLYLNGSEALKVLYPYDMISNQKYFWKYVFEKNNFDITIPNNLGLNFNFESILDKKSLNLIDQLKNSSRKKILFVNIKGRSGQTDNENWLSRIDNLASLCPEWDFYYTNSEDIISSNTNVIHTPNVFGDYRSDIIHNAYLSTFCDIIVAKNSGAFQAISMQNRNVLNQNKILICQTQNNVHVDDLECFYNRTLYKATNIHTQTTPETFVKLEEILAPMSVNVREITKEEVANIDRSIFEKENWYLMAWGMGDATAATMFLESRSPVPYKILCQKRVFNGIKFILDNYTPYPHKCLEVVVYPDGDIWNNTGYPFDQNEIMMSCNGFFPQDSRCMAEAHRYGKLKVAHMPFNYWDFCSDIQNTGVLQKAYDYDLKATKDIEEKTCILFPERGDSWQMDDTFWQSIVDKMKEKGYRVFVNMTKKTGVFKNQKTFEGTEPLNKYELQELMDYIVRHKNLVIVGQACGIFDLFKYLGCLKLMVFAGTDGSDPSMPDPTRAGYQNAHLHETPFTKNHIDIKTSEFDVRQLDLIVP